MRATTHRRLATLERRPGHQRPGLWIFDDAHLVAEPAIEPLRTCANGFRVRYGHCRPGEALGEFLDRAGFDASAYEVVHVPLVAGIANNTHEVQP